MGSSSYDLFCRWKHVKRIQSDNAGAIALGVTRATVSAWKQGKNAEIHYVEKMAAEIGDSPEVWAAQVMAERANSEDERSAWARIARKLAGVATLLLVGVLGAQPARAHAPEQGFDKPHTLYIMRNSLGRSVTWPACSGLGWHTSCTAPSPRPIAWTLAHGSDRIRRPAAVLASRRRLPERLRRPVRDQLTRNHVRLHGPWAGWRLAGRDLVSPDGNRLSPERLRGLAWRQTAEARRDAAKARNANSGHRGVVTVLRIPVRDWRAERFGSRAG